MKIANIREITKGEITRHKVLAQIRREIKKWKIISDAQIGYENNERPIGPADIAMKRIEYSWNKIQELKENKSDIWNRDNEDFVRVNKIVREW